MSLEGNSVCRLLSYGCEAGRHFICLDLYSLVSTVNLRLLSAISVVNSLIHEDRDVSGILAVSVRAQSEVNRCSFSSPMEKSQNRLSF